MTKQRKYVDDVEKFTRDLSRLVVRVKATDLKPGMVLDSLPNPGLTIKEVVVNPNTVHNFIYGYITFRENDAAMTLTKTSDFTVYQDSI